MFQILIIHLIYLNFINRASYMCKQKLCGCHSEFRATLKRLRSATATVHLSAVNRIHPFLCRQWDSHPRRTTRIWSRLRWDGHTVTVHRSSAETACWQIVCMCWQERREREQQDLEFAKEMAEDDDDSFPWVCRASRPFFLQSYSVSVPHLC